MSSPNLDEKNLIQTSLDKAKEVFEGMSYQELDQDSIFPEL
jgi:hypothetical protein